MMLFNHASIPCRANRTFIGYLKDLFLHAIDLEREIV